MQQDAAAWGLAFLPLATALSYFLAYLVGVNHNVVSLAALLTSVALVVVDKRNLVRTGRVSQSSLPSTAWFLVSAVYLFKRAKRLGGPKTLFWVSIVCSILAVIISIAIVVTAATRLADAKLADADPVLPGCADRGSIPDVVGAFDTVEGVRNAGLHGVIVTDQTEIAQGPGATPTTRLCSGTMQASNARAYDIRYEFEIVQGQVIITVELQ
ncbi:MAG: hypothetical protein ACRYG8_34415 [Janthinobacterium lividum]